MKTFPGRVAYNLTRSPRSGVCLEVAGPRAAADAGSYGFDQLLVHRLSCHADCGIGTYFFITAKGKTVPIPRMFDLMRLFGGLNDLAAELEARGPGSRPTRWDKARAGWLFLRSYRWRNMRSGITPFGFVGALRSMTDKSYAASDKGRRAYRTMMAGGMHFMDRYNYDTERVRRCVIQYSTPAGIFPFCTINCGPTYRPYVEALHARPLS